MVPEQEVATETDVPPPGRRRRLGIWVAVFGLTFLAIAIQTALFLASDFLPARHIDIAQSRFETLADGRSRLTLVLRDAISKENVSYRVVAPTEEDGEYVVEVRSQARRKNPTEGRETVTLVIDLPPVKHVTVLDKRWDHPSAHPQGFRFEMP